MADMPSPLLLPCLRGRMGDWIYYVTLMSFHDVAKRVQYWEDIHQHKLLREALQRELTDRADGIAEYLLRQEQRFFNALIVGIVDGEPAWYEIAVSGNALISTDQLPEAVRISVGVLSLNGQENMYALDGQHRAEGIRRALAKKPSLSPEEQTVIFVAHRNDDAGMQRSRRLFSVLNRYAKPVTLGEIIVLDEDDPIAIVSRRLVEEHPVLSKPEVIIAHKTKTVPRNNRTCWTTLQCLYEVVDILHFPRDIKPEAKRLAKQKRPSDVVINRMFHKASNFIDHLCAAIAPLRELAEAKVLEGIAGKYRTRQGGHLLYRPVGMLALARAIKRGTDMGQKLGSMMAKVARVPLELSSEPWAGLLWEPRSQKMRTDKDNQLVAADLIAHMLGLLSRAEDQRLRKEYAELLDIDAKDIRLPRMV